MTKQMEEKLLNEDRESMFDKNRYIFNKKFKLVNRRHTLLDLSNSKPEILNQKSKKESIRAISELNLKKINNLDSYKSLSKLELNNLNSNSTISFTQSESETICKVSTSSSSVTSVSKCSNFDNEKEMIKNSNRLVKGACPNRYDYKKNFKPYKKISAYSDSSASASCTSTSSFSSDLSDDSTKQKKNFKNKQINSVALSYYNHLYNEKQKKLAKFNKKSSNSNDLPPLYSKTIINKNDINNLKKRKYTIPKLVQDFLNFNNMHSSLYSSSSSSSSFNDLEIKQVKFKNYGLHKSLGDELNRIKDNCFDKKHSHRSKSVKPEKNRKHAFKSCSPPRQKFIEDYSKSSEVTITRDSGIESNFLNNPILMSIDTKNSGGGLVTAEIKLNERSVKFDMKKVNETKYELKLIPTKIGVYQVHMFVNKQAVKGSPFPIKIDSIKSNESRSETSEGFFSKSCQSTYTETNTSSSKQIKTELYDLSNRNEDLIVGEEVKLNIKILEYENKDKVKKSLPNIDTKVCFSDKTINHSVDILPNGVYQIKFLPIYTGVYEITFYRDGQKIQDSTYKLNIKGKYLRELLKPNFCQVGVPYILNIEYCNTTNLKAVVYTEKVDSNDEFLFQKNVAKIVNLPIEKVIDTDSKMRIKFLPLQPNEHLVDVIDNGKSIEGFPIRINAFPNKDIFLINENINGVKLGSIAKFRIYLNGQKESLNIKITNIDCNIGQHASFLLNDQYQQSHHIFGALCKFLRISSNRVINRQLMFENGQTKVNFFLAEDNKQISSCYLLKELKEIIDNEKFVIIDLAISKTIKAVKNSFKYGVKGESVDFNLEKKFNKQFDFLGEFRPNSIGRYRIDVENFDQAIQNSPFFINVFDPSLVDLVNLPKNFILGTENMIEVDLSKCGYAHFESIIESPNGLKLPYKIDSSFNKTIRFIPREVGVHKVYLKIGDYLLNDNPYEIEAVELDFPTVYGNGLYHGIENTFSLFYIQIPNHIDGNLTININDPKQNSFKSYITKLSEYLYEVKYLPTVIGTYKIEIKFNNEHIPLSPFYSNIINPDKVKILDENFAYFNPLNNFDLELNQEKFLCFNTDEAGPGDINFSIEAPNDELLPFNKKRENNIHKFFFNPVYEGKYKINLYINNHKVNYSPITARTLGYSILNDIKIYGNGIYKAELNKESTFYLDCSNVKDLNQYPEISFLDFSKEQNDLKINVVQIKKNVYKCTYIPVKPGNYLINIKVNKTHVAGSPFELKIGLDSDPSKVKVDKNDLKYGVLGQELSTLIDTRNSGIGELSANCFGSSKLALSEILDQKDGTYLLKIIPQEIGKHVLSIKYNDVHIPNSPFTLKVSSPPDASKVNVIGPGICHGIIQDFESSFICDTRGAGAGQLTVRIRGPKGAFRVDMQRLSEKDRKIMCKYDPLETGEYQINVKWSGKHVPNSPFTVNIFKTKQELDQFLEENKQEALNQETKQIAYSNHDLFKNLII